MGSIGDIDIDTKNTNPRTFEGRHEMEDIRGRDIDAIADEDAILPSHHGSIVGASSFGADALSPFRYLELS